jgi:glycosyltransferase A (GT-A) superfamily protein (DUF2064 family)
VKDSALVLMAREPTPGRCKTRLIPRLGPAGAAAFFASVVADRLAGHQRAHRHLGLYLAHSPDPAPALAALRDRHGPAFELLAQRGPDLPARMEGVFETLWSRGHGKVVMTNADSPWLPPGCVERARALLEDERSIVLGPDRGGGYYLVALCQPLSGLFRAADGAGSSYERTSRRARASGRPVHELPATLDVDRPADLDHLLTELPSHEATDLENTLRFLRDGGLLPEAGRAAGNR